eukprot:99649-Prorocentrum_minimum.AAC.3
MSSHIWRMLSHICRMSPVSLPPTPLASAAGLNTGLARCPPLKAPSRTLRGPRLPRWTASPAAFDWSMCEEENTHLGLAHPQITYCFLFVSLLGSPRAFREPLSREGGSCRGAATRPPKPPPTLCPAPPEGRSSRVVRRAQLWPPLAAFVYTQACAMQRVQSFRRDQHRMPGMSRVDPTTFLTTALRITPSLQQPEGAPPLKGHHRSAD